MDTNILFKKVALGFVLLGALSPVLAADYLPGGLKRSHRRRQTIPTLPGSWHSLGCVTDGPGFRTLLGAAQAGPTNTIESCIAFCESKKFVYAGTEYGAECYCGNNFSSASTNATSTDCNVACAGNNAELCGGAYRLNLFWNGSVPPAPPTVPATIGKWSSLGCWTDNVGGVRSLPHGAVITGPVTLEKCTSACFNAGYGFAGAEYSAECFCGSTLIFGTAAPLSDCNVPCTGDSSENCGGPNRLNLYNYTGTDLGAPGAGGNIAGNPSVSPVKTGLPQGWSYDACWVDNAHGRILIYAAGANATNTVQSCISTCAANNHTIAAMEYSAECYCGRTLVNGATKAVDADCNMGCTGNQSQACGGPSRVSVYSSGTVTALPVPSAQTTGLPSKWAYKGCLREPTGSKMFPYEIVWPTNNTAVACMNQCAAFGFDAAGVEYGEECYCGDISDIAAKKGVFGDESECSTPCSGDPTHRCGAGNRLTTYFLTGGLHTWHTPTNTGHYEFFVPGVIIPLIATVGVNNKITFLEKHGTGFPNSTGAYELDLSLANNFSAAWREMHVKTDVFCAGSVVLPDKAGRQINVGGWSLDSTFGVRLYTPDGHEGVNSTNEWEENFKELSLQRGRWYPTAAILSNGSILVIGGETGSNAAPQPNLEILPKPVGGNTVVNLDWLARTDPNNLYPFVIILPSQRIFIVYYNEARILDPVTFQTVVVLPNMPGAVNDFTAGRTYPLEGVAVPFPQKAPYTDPLRVLVCGGSTIGGGYALDNCVTTAPEVEHPTWTIERMPSRRVMPCMVSLPDGTIMILNGAHHGAAGFGLAEDPNLNAILYDPEKPVHSRFSILGNTSVARLYHSEATLLPDGRVLVSGSDPQTNNPDGTVKYPEEFRIEVYVPPYLSQGFKQPTFALSSKDWSYYGAYTITNVHLFQGTTATMRVSLVAATSSTHGNTMGARTIFPAFTCVGTICTIIAPPNAGVSPPGWHQLFVLDGPTPSHSQWVRIGGDPAQLGNWPNFPDFTRPGV